MKIIPLITLIALLCPAVVRADEIEDAINAALKLYKEGKLDEAAVQLDAATKSLDAKQGLTVAAVLPDDIAGWKGGKTDTSSLAALGGGQTIERSYRKGEKKAVISIVAGSPTLNQVSAFLANPAIGGLLGMKAKKVGDVNAMVQPKEGLLQFAVNERYLVAVQGRKLTENELAELAAGVNIDLLKAKK